MKRRSQVPKWIERAEGKVPVGRGSNQPMNFNRRDARKPRPAQNKGRGIQGGYWGHKND